MCDIPEKGTLIGSLLLKGIRSPCRKAAGQKVIRAVGHTHRGVRDAELLLFPDWKERKKPGKSTKRLNVGFWLEAEQRFPSWLKFGVMSSAWLCEKRENDLKTFLGGFGEMGSGSIKLQKEKRESFRETFSQTSAPGCQCVGGLERNFSGRFERNFLKVGKKNPTPQISQIYLE